MNNNIEIRLGDTRDYNTVISFFNELDKEMNDMLPGILKCNELGCSKEQEELFKEVLNGKFGFVLVAEKNNEILGIAIILDEEKNKTNAHLEALIIKEEYRKLHIGRTLMEEAKKKVKEDGYKYMSLKVLSNNTKALGLYEKNDFNEYMRSMICKL